MEMLNLILLTFVVLVFAAGFWCGKTYGNVPAMFDAVRVKVKSWF